MKILNSKYCQFFNKTLRKKVFKWVAISVSEFKNKIAKTSFVGISLANLSLEVNASEPYFNQTSYIVSRLNLLHDGYCKSFTYVNTYCLHICQVNFCYFQTFLYVSFTKNVGCNLSFIEDQIFQGLCFNKHLHTYLVLIN